MSSIRGLNFYNYCLNDDLYNICKSRISILSNKERDILSHFLDFSAYRNFLCGRVLVRYIIASNINVSPESLNFRLTRHGKPFLVRYGENLYFNISHTNQEICFALADAPVGIDLEKFDHQNIQFIYNALTLEERQLIKSLTDTEKNYHLIKLWTAKEAIAKCIGTGLTKEILSINLSHYIFNNVAYVNKFLLLQTFPIKDNHICTIAYDSRH